MINLVIWPSYLLLTLILILLLKYKYHASSNKIIALVITLGIVIGLGLAIYKIISDYQTYLIFNLIAEPALFALIGGLIASLFKLLFHNNKKIN